MGKKIKFLMKGVILAGGRGTRLRPLTHITNKSLLPVYDKPMILYPLETLRNSGIKEIMIVCGKDHSGHFMDFLGSGSDFGVNISYAIQDDAGGMAQALQLAEDFADSGKVAVINGDNIFECDFSEDVSDFFRNDKKGAKIFLKKVKDPHRFGVAEVKGDKVVSVYEKPEKPKSNYAIVGFYLYDDTVFKKIKKLKPSKRGELEITDLNNMYMKENKLFYRVLRGYWSDVGTFESLLATANWIAGKSKISK